MESTAKTKQGSITINKKPSRFEVSAVYACNDARADIILVHGLNGAPIKTWTAKSNGVYWPTDLLPDALRGAPVNVLVYGYNADVYHKSQGNSPSKDFIYQHAQNLVTTLTHYRDEDKGGEKKSSERPIIWICHSLGGILVKNALNYSSTLRPDSPKVKYRSVFISTHSLIFLGTPHTGSNLASLAATVSEYKITKHIFRTESVLLKTLKTDNETLQIINSQFLDIYQRFEIIMGYETQATDLGPFGGHELIVERSSAAPNLPGVSYFSVEATHSDMVKFESANASGFMTVSSRLRDWVGKAPHVIETRWRLEKAQAFMRDKLEQEEREGDRLHNWVDRQDPEAQQPRRQGTNESMSSKTPTQQRVEDQPRRALVEYDIQEVSQDDESTQRSKSRGNSLKEPPFVKPEQFRPNSFFKGREKEMKTLHTMLFDHGRRAAGTSSVLIQGMPGGGKSHLARQYVYKHQREYSGGVFWVRAKSKGEMDLGYSDIAKAAGLSEATSTGWDDETQTAKKVVKAVRDWLNRTENWLLILDGIHFDLPHVEEYIPYAKKTSILYTSTELTVPEAHLFDDPQIIKLERMSGGQARDLFLEELGRKKPYNADDLDRAQELVELMDRLPLMIHAAAQGLRASKEPLAKYLRSYKSHPRVSKLPAYHAVRQQLQDRGATPALNLMYILCFFSQQLPVEMLTLGLKALDRATPVKSHEPETHSTTLNNTFKTLIAFALVERNETAPQASSGDSQSTSVDMNSDSLDILRIHGIVQSFFVETLHEEKAVDFWLDRAVSVFCRAFDESKRRMYEDDATGMPDDYRRFSIHGTKLLSHIDKFAKKYPRVSKCREDVDTRLESIGGLINHLKDRNSQGGKARSVASVFERTNSLSETDTETPPYNNSLDGFDMMADVNTPLESPSEIQYTPIEGGNPWHFHTDVTPGLVDNDSTSGTVTPRPGPDAIFESISMPDDEDVTRRVYAMNNARHRTIKRNMERRYHDRAGAWRASPQVISDPRVSISRETARGGFVSRLPAPVQNRGEGFFSKTSDAASVMAAGFTGPAPTPKTGAEMALDRIKSNSGPMPPRLRAEGTALVQDSPTSARPPLRVSNSSYYALNPRAVASSGEESPVATFANSVSSQSSSLTKYSTGTINRLNQKENDKPVTSLEGLAPIKVSSPLATEPMTASSLVPLSQTNLPTSLPQEDPAQVIDGSSASSMIHMPSGGFRTRLSSRSSPVQPAGPFASPPPAPIVYEANTTSSLRTMPSQSAQYYRPADSPHFVPEHAIDEEEVDYEPLNLPYPISDREAALGIALHPAPWTTTNLPSAFPGYSSQPMSRDPSHRSKDSHGSSAGWSHRSGSSVRNSPGTQAMPIPRARRPSMVETEPSPDLGTPPFEAGVPMTSYRLYSNMAPQRQFIRRARAGSAGSDSDLLPRSLYPGGPVAVPVPGTPISPITPTAGSPGSPSFMSRFRSSRARGGTSSSSRRAISISGRIGSRSQRRGSGQHSSPEITVESPAGPRRPPPYPVQQPVISPSPVVSPSSQPGAGINMARSSSSPVRVGGGAGVLRLADGTVVPISQLHELQAAQFAPPYTGTGLPSSSSSIPRTTGATNSSETTATVASLSSRIPRAANSTAGAAGRRRSSASTSSSAAVGLGIQPDQQHQHHQRRPS